MCSTVFEEGKTKKKGTCRQVVMQTSVYYTR